MALLGAREVRGDARDLAGSEYLYVEHGLVAGRPRIDMGLEIMVQSACRRLVREGVVESAHDCSDGGLAVALAECCIAGGVGFRDWFTVPGRWDAALFGERQSRIVVSLPAELEPELRRICAEESAPWVPLGRTGGDTLALPHAADVPIARLADVWQNALERALAG